MDLANISNITNNVLSNMTNITSNSSSASPTAIIITVVVFVSACLIGFLIKVYCDSASGIFDIIKMF
jgi:hypothetical protein